MYVAKLVNGVLRVGDHTEFFPTTSFPKNVTLDVLDGCMAVVGSLPYNEITEQLVACEPYELNGSAYIVRVEALDAETIQLKIKQKEEDIKNEMVAVIDNYLLETARSYGYDTILSMCTYATSAVERFQQQGQAAVNFRDATWSAAIAIMNEVVAGTRAVPTASELVAWLPKIALGAPSV